MSPLTDALNRIMAWLQQNCPACTSGFHQCDRHLVGWVDARKPNINNIIHP
ncbi:MAG: hypothetical protein KME17_15990 [Cyanosarcina radialis HA8281-LM2]|nr:hypothetical protein [Cyanosarcina radialis HA8281-LM2]